MCIRDRFQTGTAPHGMEESFQGFKKQMTDIYEDSLATGADLPEGYNALFGKMLGKADTTPERLRPVSYTHLDVYKRQALCRETIKTAQTYNTDWRKTT